MRDGKSYSTRRVTAIQHGNAIFSIMVSFHVDEESAFDHQDKMPDVPPPEKLTAEEVAKQPMFREMPEFIRRYDQVDRPIELRPVELDRYFGEKIEDGRIHVWIRTARSCRTIRRSTVRARLRIGLVAARCGDGPSRAYAVRQADHGREPRPRDVVSSSVPRRRMAALFAGFARARQGGRGLTRGMIFKQDGTLVASVAQEGSLRQRK